MFEESNYLRLAALDRQAAALRNHFAALLKVKDFIAQFYPTGTLTTMEITKVDDYNVEATYMNTTVRFQLLITYNKHDRATGRVVCLNKNATFEKVQYDYLGEFSVDTNGYTNLPEHPQRGARTISQNGDEIVIAYLDKAVKQGPKWLTEAVKASASE
ncbi:hypothetical protein [Massilia suwonensis]|uniref:Uncharacterized protein n=1 Tax=Massilia suwonensis TaxID=648895 RepID=A0ABW0MSE2_9BURK